MKGCLSMRSLLNLSPRSRARRSWHRSLVACAVALATLSADALVGVPISVEAAGTVKPPKAVAAQDLPALRSEPAAPPKLDIPAGDFSNPPGEASSDVTPDRNGVKAGATLVGRSSGSEIWDNHDGTSTAVVHSRPSVWADQDGKHKAVNSHLVRQGSRLKNTGGPIGFDLPEATTDNNEVVIAAAEDWSLGFAMEGMTAGRPGVVDGASVRYRDIRPGVDLVETIEGDTLKETIVLTELPRPGSSNRFRFPLTMSNLTPAKQKDGSVRFYDRAGTEVASIPEGIAFDASGDPARGTQAQTPVHLDLTKVAGRWTVELSVDRDWLFDGDRVAPISIDPSATFNAGRESGSAHSDAFVSQAAPTTNYNALLDSGSYVDKVGYASYPTGQFNTFLKYDVSALAGKTVTAATWNGYFLTAAAYPSTYALTQASASWTDSTLTWNNQPGVSGTALTGSVTAASQWAAKDVTSWVQGWLTTPSSNNGIRLDSNGTNAYLRLAAMEQATQDSYIAVTFTNTPANTPSQSQLTPADGASTTSLTPTLTSTAMTDADGDAVKYWFRLATDTDAETGQQVNSGWLTTPSFQVPTGALQDGMTYYWKVFTSDGWNSGLAPTGVPVYSSWPPNSLKVARHLGEQSAMDTVGPVSVNLATGNVVTDYSTRTLDTVGGPIGLTLTYNSQAPSPYGLSGTYYGECGTGASPTFPTEPLVVRQDPTVDFSWGSGSPASVIAADHFCARWSGYLTVPSAATNWQIGATHDDGVRIYLNDDFTTPYVNQWVDGSGTHYGANLSLAANQAIPITVEYYDNTGTANMTLRVAGPNNIPVPAEWLSRTPAPLPQGWALSAGTYQGLSYSSARIGNNSVVLIDPRGGSHEYRRSGTRTFKPAGDDQAIVRQNSDGTFTVLAEDGLTYLFSKSGKLTSATRTGDVDLNRASATQTFDSAGILTSISDPISGRALTLKYGNDTACTTPPPGFDSTAPVGDLCQINYPDGNKTSFFYISKQLARIVEPGNTTTGAPDSPPVTDFAYDANGRLTKIRDPFLADKVATNPTALDNDTTRVVISYDSSSRAASVTLPVPNAGDTPALSAPAHSYDYVSASETQIDAAGLSPTSGFARKVTFDSTTSLILTDTDATGHTTTTAWDSKERPIATTDPAGLKTTTVYDQNGQATDVYGPAPASCFTGQLPNGSCTSPAVPHATTAYDEGIQGLAGTYWKTIDQSGAPARHSTGVGDPTGALNYDWNSDSPFGTAGSAQTDNWSARFTGEILLPQTGTYTFQLDSDDGVALTIDDTEIIYDWQDHNGFGPTGTFNNTVANSRHRIQVDYYEHEHNAEIHLYWTPPGGSQALVPGTNLFPNYGLMTSTVDADGKKTAIEYSNGAIGPEYGLPTTTIVDPSPTHQPTTGYLNLITATTYETPGASGSYVRELTRVLPKGSGTTVTSSYYGATETAPTNNCNISTSVAQAGMLKQTVDANGITKKMVYDGFGRVAGMKVGTDANWSCVTYDGRGRITSAADRDLIVTTMNYATVNQVTASYTDSSGLARTTIAKMDLLGRPISYTDELGTVSRTVYDQAGRVTGTYRTFAGQTETALTTIAYDDSSRPTSQTEYASGTGRTTTFGYDSAGRLQTTTAANGVVTTATYDPNSGTVTGRSNKQGGTTEISPWTYTLSPAGRISTETTTGRTRAFTYDAAGRLTQTNENSGATVRNYAYDANSNRCANAASCSGATFTYNNGDRITASPYASAYSYDAHGNTIATTGTTGNPSMKFAYDANDHATVTNDGTTTIVNALAPSGRVLRRTVITNSTGVVSEDISFGYANAGDSPVYQIPTPTNLPWPVILGDGWTDNNGNGWDSAKWVTTSNDSTKVADIQSNQARLYVNGSPVRATSQQTATADSEVDLTYRFNERTSGSFLRLFARASGATGSNQMPNAYRLEIASGSSTVKLQKFVNSTVTDLASFTYTQDTNTQKIRFQIQGSSIKAKLWAAGSNEPGTWSVTATDSAITGTGIVQVAHSHSSGAHTVYVDDLSLAVPGPAASAVVTSYIPGAAGLLATDVGGTATYAVANNHGDVVGTTNGSGTHSATPSNDEFGRGGAPTSRLGWTGAAERFTENTATGIIRMGVRLYDPNLGRFLSVDPVPAGSCNDYDYVCADPVNGSDLSGTFRYGYWRGIRCPHWRHHRHPNRWAKRNCADGQYSGYKKASLTTGYKAPPRLTPTPGVIEFTLDGARVIMDPTGFIGILCAGGTIWDGMQTLKMLWTKYEFWKGMFTTTIGGVIAVLCRGQS
jgi:RHS repeat-associated protein